MFGHRMAFGPRLAKAALLLLPLFLLAGCLDPWQPNAAFPRELMVDMAGRGPTLRIGGHVEAKRVPYWSLERRVVIAVNGEELGNALLADVHSPRAAATPSRISGEVDGQPVQVVCINYAISRPPLSPGRGYIVWASYATIRCQVTVAGEAAGTLLMIHNPAGFAELYR